MSLSLVSVIVFTHAPNARFLAACLGSLARQSYPSVEIIVLSDGSDAVRSVVEQFSGDKRISLLSEHEVVSRDLLAGCPTVMHQAANVCMQRSEARYLATWNGDDVYNKDHVKVLVEVLEQYPELGAAFDQVECFGDPRGDQTDLGGGTNSAADSQVLIYPAKEPTSAPFSLQELFRVNTMTGPSSLVRRSAFEQVGGYDKYSSFNCDLHWFYRIGAYFPIRSVDYVGVFKRLHPGNNTIRTPHYEHGVKELENIRDQYPEVCARIGSGLFNKKLGRKYFRLGLYYERNGDREKAKEMYRKAMALRKWSFRYHWEYARSSLMPGS